MNTQYWFVLVFSSMFLFLSFLTIEKSGHISFTSSLKAENKNLELAWKLPEYQSFFLQATYKNVNPDKQKKTEVEFFDPKMKRFTYFGYEFTDAQGKIKKQALKTLEHHLLETCFFVPDEKVRHLKRNKRLAAWESTFDVSIYKPFAFKLSFLALYEFKENQDRLEEGLVAYSLKIKEAEIVISEEDAEKNRIHKLPIFSFNADVLFNAERGILEEANYTLKTKIEYVLEEEKGLRYYEGAWEALVQAKKDILDATNKEDLNKRVEEAIKKGRDYLLGYKKETNKGSWPAFSKHHLGTNALIALTLMKCGIEPKEPILASCFEAMKDMSILKTYDACVTIMALESAAMGSQDRKKFLKGDEKKEDEEYERNLTPDQKKEMQRMVDYLLKTQVPSGGWRYVAPSEEKPDDYDFSANQYVALALNAARRSGIQVPLEVWGKFVQHTLNKQEKDGPEVKRSENVEIGSSKKAKRGKTAVRYAKKPDRARGWGYQGSWAPYGSMSSGGVTILACALDTFLSLEEEDRDAKQQLTEMFKSFDFDLEEIETAIYDGLAWLTFHYQISFNPRHPGHWDYYYLYALERCCVLTQTQWLDHHDWYNEGALCFVYNQSDDGRWEGKWDPVIDTCFALLFLTRGTTPPPRPVLTGKK